MNKYLRWTLLPVALLIGACQAADGGADAAAEAEAAAALAADEAALDELREGYASHYNMGHADVVTDYFQDDGVGLFADGTVARGRDAILAFQQGQMAEGSPQVVLTDLHRKIFGNHALSMGRWDVSITAEGADPVQVGGHYMTASEKGPDAWKLMGVISNYDRQQSAEMLQGTASAEPPAEESTMGDMLRAYEAAWNAGDAAAVTELYADDAKAAFADLPLVEGKVLIGEIMADRVAGQMELHGVRTVDLGDGWTVDGGWYRMTGLETGNFVGNYWTVSHEDEDGVRKIDWVVSNGRPEAVIPSAN